MNTPTHTEKDVNNFYSPATASGQDTVKTFISAGDKRFSSFDRHGQAELLQRAYECLGTTNSFQGVHFSREMYDSFNFVLCYDMEKVGNHASGSGMNLSHGQLLKIHVEGAGKAGTPATTNPPAAATDDSYVKRAYTTCRFDSILELTSTGASVHS